MTVLEALMVGGVAYRLWRLLAVDQIGQPLRERLPQSGWVFDWWSCPWCLGSWLTVGVGVAAWWAGLIGGSPWLVIPAAAVVCGWLGDNL